jgi:hypothetical protein
VGDDSTNFEIDDPGGGVRIAGIAGSPGAAASSVLTADGDGGTSWEAGGGSGFAPITALYTGPGSPSFMTNAVLPNTLSGDGSPGGVGASGLFTSPPVVVGAMGNVVVGSAVQLHTSGVVVVTSDNLDLTLQGFVTDLTGTNKAHIVASGAVSAPVTDCTLTIDLTTGTWSILSGTDLSDGGSGTLVSTAGGVFVVTFSPIVGWD